MPQKNLQDSNPYADRMTAKFMVTEANGWLDSVMSTDSSLRKKDIAISHSYWWH